MVDGWLSRDGWRNRECAAADTAIDATCVGCWVPASATSKCDKVALTPSLRAQQAIHCHDCADRWIASLAMTAGSAQPLPCQLRARTQRRKLRFRDIPPHRRHAAIRRRDDVALGYKFRHRLDDLHDVLGRLD